MTIITSFRSTTFIKAFALNSILLAITTTVAYSVYKNLDNIENLPSWANGIITLVMTFLVSLSGYILFFYLFSFGGGMLAEKYHVNDFTLFSD